MKGFDATPEVRVDVCRLTICVCLFLSLSGKHEQYFGGDSTVTLAAYDDEDEEDEDEGAGMSSS